MFWKTLCAAPHRTLFLPGALQGLCVMAWWLLELESGLGTLALPPSALLPGAAHAWLMLYGFFPFFVFGFAFTAVPSWLDGPKIRPSHAIGTALLLSAGTLLFYPAIYRPAFAAPAVLLHAAGLVVGLAGLLHSLAGSTAADKRHAWAIWLALLTGLIGELCFLAWLHTGTPRFLSFALSLALWGCLTPVFLTVCHRMVPWFTSRVLSDYVMVRPYPLLWSMLIASLSHAVLEASGQAAYTWLADLPLAAAALYFSTHWGLVRSFKVRLLAMLHIAFAWATLAFGLAAAGSLGLLLRWPWSAGLAPLHTLGIGFFGSMLIAMASRVSLGHSGNKLAADGLTWLLFWLVQIAAGVRLLPDLLPGIAPYRLASLAAVLWLAAFGGWAWRYAPLYWRPRADGKPG